MVMPMATMAQEPQEQDASSLQNVVAIYPVQGERVLFSFASNPELSYTATELAYKHLGKTPSAPTASRASSEENNSYSVKNDMRPCVCHFFVVPLHPQNENAVRP